MNGILRQGISLVATTLAANALGQSIFQNKCDVTNPYVAKRLAPLYAKNLIGEWQSGDVPYDIAYTGKTVQGETCEECCIAHLARARKVTFKPSTFSLVEGSWIIDQRVESKGPNSKAMDYKNERHRTVYCNDAKDENNRFIVTGDFHTEASKSGYCSVYFYLRVFGGNVPDSRYAAKVISSDTMSIWISGKEVIFNKKSRQARPK